MKQKLKCVCCNTPMLMIGEVWHTNLRRWVHRYHCQLCEYTESVYGNGHYDVELHLLLFNNRHNKSANGYNDGAEYNFDFDDCDET